MAAGQTDNGWALVQPRSTTGIQTIVARLAKIKIRGNCHVTLLFTIFTITTNDLQYRMYVFTISTN